MTKKSEQTQSDMLWLAQKIVKAYQNYGFVSAVVFGKQGTGKTTYAFKVLRDVYYTVYNLRTKDEAWSFVRNAYFFELPEALEMIRKAINEDKRIPALLFDDAGIWLSKYEWFSDYMKQFYKLYALIRTRVSAIIFTTPSPDDVARYLREKGWYQIRITMVNRRKKEARALLYEKTFTRNSSGQIVTTTQAKAIDFFKVDLPNDFYREYLERRRKTEQRILEELDSILKREEGSEN